MTSATEAIRPAPLSIRWRAVLQLLRTEPWLIAGVLLLAAVAHGFNMQNFPYYENDEGIYVSQAWAVANAASLAPYTYIYDHSPVGWIQMAALSALTGGFYTFGTSIETGRVMMLAIQVVSTGLVYLIARRLTGSVALSIAAALAFALSAYGIYYHRRVLLDNLATVWMLASVALLLRPRLSLTTVWASAAALGISILSKEVTIFLVPAVALLVLHRAHRSQRWLAGIGWLAIVGSIVSMYVLLATLKGELFPATAAPGELAAHVSLLGTLAEQAARGRDGGLLEAGSQFWITALEWAGQEPLLIAGGSAAAVVSLLLVHWRREAAIFGLMTLSIWLFIGRGGVVLPFYAVPLLPLLAINLVVLLDIARRLLRRVVACVVRRPGIPERGALVAGAAVMVALVLPGYVNGAGGFERDPLILWRGAEASAQREALDWVKANLPADSSIVIDRYLWTDLQAPPAGETQRYALAHDYRKIDADPYIRENVFAENWRNFDYLVYSGQLVHDVQADDLAFVGSILEHSTRIATFDSGGWPVYVNRVDKQDVMSATNDGLLLTMWDDYVARFIDDGRVGDPQRQGETTSEGQAYAMLRAVYMNDRATFDEVWAWTRQHLQVRSDDSLLAWLWSSDNGGAVLDDSPAADADEDAALALLFAAQQWNDASYQEDAQSILDSIWSQLTQEIAGQRMLIASDWAGGDQPVVNPSYLAPYAYRIFAEADPAHRWSELIDSSYALFAELASSETTGGTEGLVPNWVVVDRRTGVPGRATDRVRSADEFSFDASRVPFRLALDWIWFAEPRALAALEAFDLPAAELAESGRLLAAYDLDGRPTADYEAGSMYAGAIPLLLLEDRALAIRILTEKVIGPALAPDSLDHSSYYAQNWAWFAIALVDGGMANLWAEETTASWRERP
jgi:endo-1,4-beta-D-glucanase Y